MTSAGNEKPPVQGTGGTALHRPPGTRPGERARRTFALVAVLFGAVTLVAAARVLAGADPGYAVFRPLLVYNAAMGAAYIAAGVLIWQSLAAGRRAAGIVFSLNLLVLAAVAALHLGGGAVAIQSVLAMTFRTAVWLALFLGLARLRPGS